MAAAPPDGSNENASPPYTEEAMETRQPLRLLALVFISAGLGLTFCSSSTESEQPTPDQNLTVARPPAPLPESTLRPLVPIEIAADAGTAPGHVFTPISAPPAPVEHPCPGCPPPDPPPPDRDPLKPQPPLPPR
jgi:hypothetical protein